MPTMSGPEQMFCRSGPWRAWTRRIVLPWALDGTAPHGEVLEIGAGGGSMAAGLIAGHPNLRLTLTDIDPKMVAATRHTFANQPSVRVQQADATGLPYHDDTFDYALTFLMLHHVVDWPAGLTELRRVLKPTGVLLGYDLTATPTARLVHWADRSPHRLISPHHLHDGLTDAGFTNAHVAPSWAGHVMRFRATTDPEGTR